MRLDSLSCIRRRVESASSSHARRAQGESAQAWHLGDLARGGIGYAIGSSVRDRRADKP